MTGPRIVFLPDYGPAIGGGHVMRSLTLARALQERGARCAFAVGEDTARMMQPFARGEVEIWPADGWPEQPAVAVVDNYALTADDERALAARGVKVVVIDDIGRAHDCDLVVDPGLGRTPEDYPGRAHVLAGAAYALVRPEFLSTPIARQGGAGARLAGPDRCRRDHRPGGGEARDHARLGGCGYRARLGGGEPGIRP